MKTSKITIIATLGLGTLALMFSGCASTCGSNGIFGRRPFQNQPVRSTIRSWFQGAECDTCNPPSGQHLFSPNVAPLCDTCNTGAPVGGQVAPLYGSPIGAQLGTPQIQNQPQTGLIEGGLNGNPPTM